MPPERYRDLELLVWSGAWKILREQELAPEGSWVYASQFDARDFAEVRPGFPNTPLPAAPEVAAILMVKDEADIIGSNLEWHYLCGIRKFVIMDNGSVDETAFKLSSFKWTHGDAEVLIIQDPIVRHIQAEKITAMFHMAKIVWPDITWVLPIDADEFLIPTQTFEPLKLLDSRIDCLVLPRVSHFRRRGDRFRDWMRPFEDMPLRSQLFGSPPKILARANLAFSVTQGNHHLAGAQDINYAGGFRSGFYIREFPNRSFEHFLRKTRNGGLAIVAAHRELQRDVGGQHWFAAFNILINLGPSALLAHYERDSLRSENDGFTDDPFVPPEPRAFAGPAV